MNQKADANMPLSGSGRRRTIAATFVDALTRPNEQAYTEIVNDPGASIGKAFLWIFLANIIGSGFFTVVDRIVNSHTYQITQQYRSGTEPYGVIGSSMLTSVYSLLGLAIYIGITHIIAKQLGGAGEFKKLIYGFSAFISPSILIGYILGGVAGSYAWIGIVGLLYLLYLQQQVIVVVYKLPRGQAFGTIIVALTIFSLFSCLWFYFYALKDIS